MKLGLGPETVLAFSSRGIIFSLLAIVVATASVTNEKEVGKMGQKHLSPASKNTSIRVTKWIQNDTILPDGGRQQQHEGVDQLRFRKAHRRLYLNNSPEFFEIESDAEFQAYALGLRVHQAAATKEEGMTQCSGGTDDVQGSSTTTFCQFDGATCCDGGNFCCRRGSQCFSQATEGVEKLTYLCIHHRHSQRHRHNNHKRLHRHVDDCHESNQDSGPRFLQSCNHGGNTSINGGLILNSTSFSNNTSRNHFPSSKLGADKNFPASSPKRGEQQVAARSAIKERTDDIIQDSRGIMRRSSSTPDSSNTVLTSDEVGPGHPSPPSPPPPSHHNVVCNSRTCTVPNGVCCGEQGLYCCPAGSACVKPASTGGFFSCIKPDYNRDPKFGRPYRIVYGGARTQEQLSVAPHGRQDSLTTATSEDEESTEDLISRVRDSIADGGSTRDSAGTGPSRSTLRR